MEDKRSDNMSDLRRQRERIRRITIGTLLVAVIAVLGSCDGLVNRNAGSQVQSETQTAIHQAATTQRRLVLRAAGPQSDRP